MGWELLAAGVRRSPAMTTARRNHLAALSCTGLPAAVAGRPHSRREPPPAVPHRAPRQLRACRRWKEPRRPLQSAARRHRRARGAALPAAVRQRRRGAAKLGSVDRPPRRRCPNAVRPAARAGQARPVGPQCSPGVGQTGTRSGPAPLADRGRAAASPAASSRSPPPGAAPLPPTIAGPPSRPRLPPAVPPPARATPAPRPRQPQAQ